MLYMPAKTLHDVITLPREEDELTIGANLWFEAQCGSCPYADVSMGLCAHQGKRIEKALAKDRKIYKETGVAAGWGDEEEQGAGEGQRGDATVEKKGQKKKRKKKKKKEKKKRKKRKRETVNEL